MKSVLILQRRLPKYRTDLFNLVKEELRLHNILLDVVAGYPNKSELTKNDEDYACNFRRNKSYYFLNDRICILTPYKLYKNYNMIILLHENAMVINWLYFLIYPKRKIALWGHGYNHQSDKVDIFTKIKAFQFNFASKYFAYTPKIKRYIQTKNPDLSVYAFNNSVANNLPITGPIERERIIMNKVSSLTSGKIKACFVGSYYKNKRLLEVFDIVKKIRQKFDVEFTFIGSGEDENIVNEFCGSNDKCRNVGSLWGSRKQQILREMHFIINPGLVGLGVFDAFHNGAVYCTVDTNIHSPEYDYLNDKNAIIASKNSDELVKLITNVIHNPALYEKLMWASLNAGEHFTLTSSAKKISDGILAGIE